MKDGIDLQLIKSLPLNDIRKIIRQLMEIANAKIDTEMLEEQKGLDALYTERSNAYYSVLDEYNGAFHPSKKRQIKPRLEIAEQNLSEVSGEIDRLRYKYQHLSLDGRAYAQG